MKVQFHINIIIISAIVMFMMAKIVSLEAEMGHRLSNEFGQWIVAK